MIDKEALQTWEMAFFHSWHSKGCTNWLHLSLIDDIPYVFCPFCIHMNIRLERLASAVAPVCHGLPAQEAKANMYLLGNVMGCGCVEWFAARFMYSLVFFASVEASSCSWRAVPVFFHCHFHARRSIFFSTDAQRITERCSIVVLLTFSEVTAFCHEITSNSLASFILFWCLFLQELKSCKYPNDMTEDSLGGLFGRGFPPAPQPCVNVPRFTLGKVTEE